MPRRTWSLLACALPLLAACAAPLPPRTVPLGLEPPVMSPPGDLSADQRLQWWQEQLPRLSSEDRVEARLLMGELNLEVRRSADARVAFYEAKGGRISAAELARAERGIGLSYFLDGNVSAGVTHLERSLSGLTGPAMDETAYLLAAARGESVSGLSDAAGERMQGFLAEANLKAPTAEVQVQQRGAIAFDVSRSQWGAAKMHANWDRMTTPYRITVHHTAMPFSSTDLGASRAEVRTVQRLHMNDRGMADVGYHFLIDREGRVFEGRPLYAQGAHSSGDHNIGNIGICLLGNFVSDPESGADHAVAQAPTVKQMETLERLTGEICEEYEIKGSQVFGHKHWKSTACPGPHLMAWAQRYRALAAR
ncbi:MAG: peptidoglycan recognition protein family protein [Planctomycetota bacterium]